MKSKPKLGYAMKKAKISSSNKDFFHFDGKQRRMIRTGAVKSIAGQLKTNIHFNSPFVINKIDGKRRLIDGNHRWEAIQSVLESKSDFEIEVFYAEYKDLTIEEERDVFELWNIGTKQSSADFLKIYWDTIPRGKEMLDRIPASIYNSKHKIKVKDIVGNHLMAKKGGKFGGGYSAGARKVVQDFKTINSDDISIMRAYLSDLENIFGMYNSSVIFWKGTPQAALYRIWYDNRHIPPNVMKKAFEKVFLGQQRYFFEQSGKAGGIEASKVFYNMSVKELSEVRGIGKYKFIFDQGA